MSHPSREWVGLSFRKNDFPKAPLRMRATIWLFVREKRVHTSQVNGCGPPRGLFPSGTRRGAGTHILRVPVALAGRDSSAVAPVVASVVLTFTRDTGTQITQTNLTSIPTHQHDRDDRIHGRLSQNPLLKGSTEIPRLFSSPRALGSGVGPFPHMVLRRNACMLGRATTGPPRLLGEPSFTPQGLVRCGTQGAPLRGCNSC